MIAPESTLHTASTIQTASTTIPPKCKCLAELDPNVQHPLLPEVYTPLECLEYDAESILLQQPISPIECFSYFFTLKIWEVLHDGTNAYYIFKHSTVGPSERGWNPVSVKDLKIWLGLIIYMGIVDCLSIKDYWAKDT